MNKLYWLLSFVFVLVACTHNPVPKDYQGPIAYVSDTFENDDQTSAHYFELIAVDQKPIATSYGATREKYHGMGRFFDPVMVKRPIMATKQSITIRASRFYPTDAQVMFGDSLSFEKDFVFEPKEGEVYLVKGKLSESGSSVWLVDSKGQKVTESL